MWVAPVARAQKKFFKKVLTNYERCGIIKAQKENKGDKIMKKFYWFTFADGYQVCARGFDRTEKAHLVYAHGALVSKVAV